MMIECDIMKNNKGQALIEFIIILPIFLLLVISLIDVGNIFIKKNSLENNLDNIVSLYKENKNDDIKDYAIKNNLDVAISNDGKFKKFTIKKRIKLTSPLLIVPFGANYMITTEKDIYVK